MRDGCAYVHNVNEKATRKSKLCGDYRKGSCEREDCRYIHNDNPDARITRASAPQPVVPPFSFSMQPGMGMAMGGHMMGLDGKGKGGGRKPPTVCGDFNRGKCDRESCRFVHNTNPNAARDSALCGDFRLGRCTRELCRFVHAQPKEE